MQRPLERADDLEWIFLFVVQKRLRAFLNYFFTEGAIAGNGIYRKKPVNRFKVRTNSRHAKRGCCAVQQPLRVRL